MAMAWQGHGNGMAMAQQGHGNGMAMAWQWREAAECRCHSYCQTRPLPPTLRKFPEAACGAIQDDLHLYRGEVEVPNYDAGRRGTGVSGGVLDGALQDCLLLPHDL